jgi:hypothetical protein
MKRFKSFLDKNITLNKIKNSSELKNLGIICRYLPDPPEDFDEFEFGVTYDNHEHTGFIMTIEKNEIKRILFGAFAPDNPDLFKPLDESQTQSLLMEHGDKLINFFVFITTP